MEKEESNKILGLDVKPLRSLSPMFPSVGLNTFTKSSESPFVYVSTLNSSKASPFAADNQPPVVNQTQPVTPVLNKTEPSSNNHAHHPSPDNVSSPPDSVHTSSTGRRIKQPVSKNKSSVTDGTEGSSQTKLQKKKVKVTHTVDSGLIPSCLDPKDSVEVILMTFDAIRRRLSQLDDGKEVKVNQRPDLTAGNIMMTHDLRANVGKRLGSVPGVEIGDMFYFRIEMCLIGLHGPIMAGIDYMTISFGDGDDTVADSIVSAGRYENEESDVNTLIYTGQGGKSDQKLERGNLALERSLHRGNAIRVIRGVKDPSTVAGKIYYYDGLYKVDESWIEKARTGFQIFKYKLLRQPEQAPGLAIWKMTQQWKDNPSSRPAVILPDISSGIENLPVCLVNEVDGDKVPSHFRYSSVVEYKNSPNSRKHLEHSGCRCVTVCVPGDVKCTCANLNDGNFPYSATGILVCRKPLIYECGASCNCSTSCRNRVCQNGSTLRFEVFKTSTRGWGLRSWDPIRTGTFVCEYTGEVINKIDGSAEDDEYIFQALGADGKSFKWNYGPELLGEPGYQFSSDTLGQLPIVITAKNIGNVSRFMNHSCSPNLFWQPVMHDHGDENHPHIMFFAMKHIPPMTELTYDYGLTENAGSRKTKECLCGEQKCRGRFV